MAVENANIAPFINVVTTVTSPWWIIRDGVIHRGLDIATGKKDPVYSMLDGTVVQMWHNDKDLGNALVIKRSSDGLATLYMHLDSFNVSLNQAVKVGQQVGIEGTTGDSTGIHLHVEMQNMTSNVWKWSYNKSDYVDPTQFMGITNERGIQFIYDGTPIPPDKKVTFKKRGFPFVLYARKLRKSI